MIIKEVQFTKTDKQGKESQVRPPRAKLSGRGTWKSNPWVWAYDFELVTKKDLEMEFAITQPGEQWQTTSPPLLR